eukprot:gene20151-24120_t
MLRSLINRDQSSVVVPPIPHKPAEISHQRGVDTERKISDHLKMFPRETSHYANNMNNGEARYFLNPDLYLAKVWKLYCAVQKPEFAEQAESLGWWKSLDSKSSQPSVDEVILKPPLSYSWYVLRLKTFDLNFGKVKVNTCDTCDGFI